MSIIKTSVEKSGQSRSPGLAAALAMFAAGLVVGLGLAADLGGQFTAGLVILAVLGLSAAVGCLSGDASASGPQRGHRGTP